MAVDDNPFADVSLHHAHIGLRVASGPWVCHAAADHSETQERMGGAGSLSGPQGLTPAALACRRPMAAPCHLRRQVWPDPASTGTCQAIFVFGSPVGGAWWRAVTDWRCCHACPSARPAAGAWGSSTAGAWEAPAAQITVSNTRVRLNCAGSALRQAGLAPRLRLRAPGCMAPCHPTAQPPAASSIAPRPVRQPSGGLCGR